MNNSTGSSCSGCALRIRKQQAPSVSCECVVSHFPFCMECSCLFPCSSDSHVWMSWVWCQNFLPDKFSPLCPDNGKIVHLLPFMHSLISRFAISFYSFLSLYRSRPSFVSHNKQRKITIISNQSFNYSLTLYLVISAHTTLIIFTFSLTHFRIISIFFSSCPLTPWHQEHAIVLCS